MIKLNGCDLMLVLVMWMSLMRLLVNSGDNAFVPHLG